MTLKVKLTPPNAEALPPQRRGGEEEEVCQNEGMRCWRGFHHRFICVIYGAEGEGCVSSLFFCHDDILHLETELK